MPVILEQEAGRFDGHDRPLHGIFVDLGRNLGRFTFPRETILRTYKDVELPRSMPVDRFRTVLKESHSLELPPKYVVWASGDTEKIRIGVTQDHMTHVLGMFLGAHNNSARILPLQTQGKDVLFNMQPRQEGIAIPMIEGQSVCIEVLQRDAHTLSLFEHRTPDSDTTRPQSRIKAWL